MIQHFTRGGQIALHSLRMFGQVFKITLGISLLCWVIISASLLTTTLTPYQRYLLWHTSSIHLKHALQIRNKDNKTYSILSPKGQALKLTYQRINNHPLIQMERTLAMKHLRTSLGYAGLASLLLFLALMGFFVRRGKSKYKDRLVRGNRLVNSDTLKEMIEEEKIDSDLNIDELPLIKDRETSHILVTGTTGAGKTNLFRTLMPQIRKRPNRAIIVDTTGDMVEKFYDPEIDILLNPMDVRSVSWNLFDECQTQTELEGFAEALLPSGSSHSDSFWDESARVVFTAAMKKLKDQGEESIETLSRILLQSSLSEYENFFKGTYAASFTDARADKTTLSIRSNLSSKLMWLKYIKEAEEERFSVSSWVKAEDPKQWLFITSQKKDLIALKPIISAWFNRAITTLISLPINEQRRLWFVLDELASLQKLPSLEMGLAEGRKYGACFFAGTQSISQIKRIYGYQAALSCLDLFNTRFFFRSNDSETTHWISKTLGDVEIEETQENLSYGANTIRDGVSLNHTKRVKPIVLPSEIAALENLESYVKVPEGLPVTKVCVQYKTLPSKSVAFLSPLKH